MGITHDLLVKKFFFNVHLHLFDVTFKVNSFCTADCNKILLIRGHSDLK